MKTMRLSVFNGTCDLCTSNTGNLSIASWGATCPACAAQWNNYSSSCAGGTNKPCFNFNIVANGALPNSLAGLMTVATGSSSGDVYDFLSAYTSTISTCSDMVDYVINYAFTTNNDPLYGTAGVPDCPVYGGGNSTCSAACNADWSALQMLCSSTSQIQYDYNGMPGGRAAPQGTVLPIATVMTYILNGTAFGPWNNNTASGADAALLLSDASCVAASWLDGLGGISMGAPAAPPSSMPSMPGSLNITAVAATAAVNNPAPTPAGTTCLQAAALFNTSTTTGNCNQCLSDTGLAGGCAVNCANCANDINIVQSACGPTGDSTLQLTFALVSSWAQNLITVGAGNFTFGDCYIQVASTMLLPAAAACSDYLTYMVYYSQSAYMVNPNNATNNGPNCPINAADTEYPANTCPSGCAADLALLGGCTNTSPVIIPGVINALFPVAWTAFVNGSLSTMSGIQNTMKTATGASYLLGGCNSTLATYAPGVQAAGTVNILLPTALPNCSTARAVLINSTQSGACDLCSSATGIAANCFTSVSGDSDCTQCGVQFDAYTAVCNDTYNDIGNIMAQNLLSTSAGGTTGDCYDFFNQLAQSLLVPAPASTPAAASFSTDICSDAWDSIVQYSETVLNDPLNAAAAGPNCPTQAGSTCSIACNNDLALLNSSCTSTSVVQWAGFGVPGGVAPAGANVSIATAWLYFVNGTATAPIGNFGKNGSAPFALSNCSLPSFAPATGPGSAATMAPVTVTGTFSLNLGSVTPAQLYAANAGKLENAIGSSLGVSGSAITINWAALGVTLAGRHLLAAVTSISYTATVTAAQQTAVTASATTLASNPTAVLGSTLTAISNSANLTTITATPAGAASAASSFMPAIAVAMAAVATVATLM